MTIGLLRSLSHRGQAKYLRGIFLHDRGLFLQRKGYSSGSGNGSLWEIKAEGTQIHESQLGNDFDGYLADESRVHGSTSKFEDFFRQVSSAHGKEEEDDDSYTSTSLKWQEDSNDASLEEDWTDAGLVGRPSYEEFSRLEQQYLGKNQLHQLQLPEEDTGMDFDNFEMDSKRLPRNSYNCDEALRLEEAETMPYEATLRDQQSMEYDGKFDNEETILNRPVKSALLQVLEALPTTEMIPDRGLLDSNTFSGIESSLLMKHTENVSTKIGPNENFQLEEYYLRFQSILPKLILRNIVPRSNGGNPLAAETVASESKNTVLIEASKFARQLEQLENLVVSWEILIRNLLSVQKGCKNGEKEETMSNYELSTQEKMNYFNAKLAYLLFTGKIEQVIELLEVFDVHTKNVEKFEDSSKRPTIPLESEPLEGLPLGDGLELPMDLLSGTATDETLSHSMSLSDMIPFFDKKLPVNLLPNTMTFQILSGYFRDWIHFTGCRSDAIEELKAMIGIDISARHRFSKVPLFFDRPFQSRLRKFSPSSSPITANDLMIGLYRILSATGSGKYGLKSDWKVYFDIVCSFNQITLAKEMDYKGFLHELSNRKLPLDSNAPLETNNLSFLENYLSNDVQVMLHFYRKMISEMTNHLPLLSFVGHLTVILDISIKMDNLVMTRVVLNDLLKIGHLLETGAEAKGFSNSNRVTNNNTDPNNFYGIPSGPFEELNYKEKLLSRSFESTIKLNSTVWKKLIISLSKLSRWNTRLDSSADTLINSSYLDSCSSLKSFSGPPTAGTTLVHYLDILMS